MHFGVGRGSAPQAAGMHAAALKLLAPSFTIARQRGSRDYRSHSSSMAHSDDLWIFAYGSLMWRPGFAYEERQTVRVHGFHRALCVYSHIYRGTPERPGLVMGLDRGGSCLGVAFRVAPATAPTVLDYLRKRELITDVYNEKRLPVRLPGGRAVRALAYVAERRHAQYAGRLSPGALLAMVRQGNGAAGSNADYVRQTYQHLRSLGFDDALLRWLNGELAAPGA